jgi:ABC-type transport system substrate-binding protein
MKGKIGTRFLLVVLTALVFLQAGFGAGKPESPKPRELIMGATTALRHLEVHWMGNQETSVNWHIHEPLVWLEADGSIKPMLAESWTVSSDGLKWTFKLRPGIEFSNGVDFDAGVAAANIQRQLDSIAKKEPTSLAFMFADVEKVEVVDKLTFNLICKQKIGPLLNYLSILLIVPKEAIDKYGPKRIAEIYPGTGPYMKTSQVPNQGAELVVNPNYWKKGLPAVPKFVYREFKEEASMVNALRSGEVDIAHPISQAFISLLKDDKNIKVESFLPYEILFLGLKCDKPPFDNIKARQALSLSIDRKLIVDTLLGGAGRPMGAFIQEGMPGYAPQFRAPARDLVRAKQLLQESGYDGRTLKFVGPPDWYTATRETCEAIVTMMQEAGFKVELTFLEAGAFTTARTTGGYDLHFLGSRAITGEPQRYLEERIVKDLYKSGWVNKECFDLITEAGKTIDPKSKEKLYFRIQEIMYNDAGPQIFLHQAHGFYAYRSNVKNFKMLPTFLYYIPEVTKE